jgi:hypothetical protein
LRCTNIHRNYEQMNWVLNCYFFWHLMSYFFNVNCRYLVILFNEIEVWAGIEACFATVKYSIYYLLNNNKTKQNPWYLNFPANFRNKYPWIGSFSRLPKLFYLFVHFFVVVILKAKTDAFRAFQITFWPQPVENVIFQFRSKNH